MTTPIYSYPDEVARKWKQERDMYECSFHACLEYLLMIRKEYASIPCDIDMKRLDKILSELK